MRASAGFLAGLLGFALLVCAPRSFAEDLPEYRLKAAFLYNFALFTEWPDTVGPNLNLCILGKDPFGAEIDPLQGKTVGARSIAVQRRTGAATLKGCQIVFVAASSVGRLPGALDVLRDAPVLTVADSPEAARAGVALNMIVTSDRIAFDADLRAARAAGVKLSSKLLRLAREVRQ